MTIGVVTTTAGGSGFTITGAGAGLANIEERLRHALRETPQGRWTYKYDPAIGSSALETDFERLWEGVRLIRCPTLLVRGAESNVLAEETVSRFLDELPGSEAVVVTVGPWNPVRPYNVI